VRPITALMPRADAYVDTLKAGIVDPGEVGRLALLGAASIAGLLATTEAMVGGQPQSGTPPKSGGGMDGRQHCGHDK
jgi:chaperonin GroEL (HSP60 family)